MRNSWNHVTPENTLPTPLDNVTLWVRAQVHGWEHDPTTLIHPEIAMEIAAGWHGGSDVALTAFSSSGTVTDALADEIDGLIRDIELHPDTYSFDAEIDASDANHAEACRREQLALRALRAYIEAVEVDVWTVGHNTPGYLPESTPSAHMDFPDAASVYTDMVREAPDTLISENDECDCTDDELCEFHSLEAEVGAFLTDDGPSTWAPRPAEITLQPASSGTDTVFWLSTDTLTYGEYLIARDALV